MSEYWTDFPIWYLSIPGQKKPRDILAGLIQGRKFAPVFSDDDLAERL
jgi:hypothetical protein